MRHLAERDLCRVGGGSGSEYQPPPDPVGFITFETPALLGPIGISVSVTSDGSIIPAVVIWSDPAVDIGVTTSESAFLTGWSGTIAIPGAMVGSDIPNLESVAFGVHIGGPSISISYGVDFGWNISDITWGGSNDSVTIQELDGAGNWQPANQVPNDYYDLDDCCGW